jgi:hypothetical protein
MFAVQPVATFQKVFRGHLLVFCIAKPCHATATTRKHRRVRASLLAAPMTLYGSLFDVPGKISLEVFQRRVLITGIIGKVCKVQLRHSVT